MYVNTGDWNIRKVSVLILSYSGGFIEISLRNMSRHLVFVYGTLKSGEPNHGLLQPPHNARFIGRGTTTERFPLVIASRYNIPFVLDSPGQGNVSTKPWNQQMTCRCIHSYLAFENNVGYVRFFKVLNHVSWFIHTKLHLDLSIDWLIFDRVVLCLGIVWSFDRQVSRLIPWLIVTNSSFFVSRKFKAKSTKWMTLVWLCLTNWKSTQTTINAD